MYNYRFYLKLHEILTVDINFDKDLFLIAGPCAVEGRDVCFKIAESVKAIAEELNLNYIFKASFKKANRSSIHSFTGIGDEKAISILQEIKNELNLPITTDIHTIADIEKVQEVVDILQIPAFLCRQTDLLVAAAKSGKWVNIKKGQFMSPDSMKFAVDKITLSGNEKVLLTERGTTFGYQDLVVDMRSIPKMKSIGVPVVMDCTHSLQRPNQKEGVTGGDPSMISTMAYTAIAAGANGLFIETHPNPSEALSDGKNMLSLDMLKPILQKAQAIYKTIHSV